MVLENETDDVASLSGDRAVPRLARILAIDEKPSGCRVVEQADFFLSWPS
jgi:hypothetical protein